MHHGRAQIDTQLGNKDNAGFDLNVIDNVPDLFRIALDYLKLFYR